MCPLQYIHHSPVIFNQFTKSDLMYMSENYVCMYIYIHICNLKFLWLTPYCTVPVITASAECCFLAGQSLHCSLCIYVLLLLKENDLHPSKPCTLACTGPLEVVMRAPLILLFCLSSTLFTHILPTLSFFVPILIHIPYSRLHDFSHLTAGLMRGYPATKQRTSSWAKELAPSSSEPVRTLMVTSPSLSGICFS